MPGARTKTLLTVAVAAALAAGILHWSRPEERATSDAAPVSLSLSAVPGTAIVVPVTQPLSDGRLKLLSFVEGRPVFEPGLQESAQLVFSSVHFVDDATTGELLLRIADDRRRPIEFTLSAEGSGVGPDGQPAAVAAMPVDVRIAIETGPVPPLPRLKGLWSNTTVRWEFEYPRPGMITIQSVGESPRQLSYRLFPLAGGELALVASSLSERMAVRLDVDGEVLSVAPLSSDGAPPDKLRRQPLNP